jgi:hypothetical protein
LMHFVFCTTLATSTAADEQQCDVDPSEFPL